MGLQERRSLFPSKPSSPHHRSLIFAWLVFATFLAIIPEPGTGYRERGGYNTRLISVQSRACQAYSRLKTRIDQLEIDRSSEFSYHFHARGQITSDRKSKLSMIRLLFMHSIHCCQTCVRACVEATQRFRIACSYPKLAQNFKIISVDLFQPTI